MISIAFVIYLSTTDETLEDRVIVHTIIDSRRKFEDVIISKLSRCYEDKT